MRAGKIFSVVALCSCALTTEVAAQQWKAKPLQWFLAWFSKTAPVAKALPKSTGIVPGKLARRPTQPLGLSSRPTRLSTPRPTPAASFKNSSGKIENQAAKVSAGAQPATTQGKNGTATALAGGAAGGIATKATETVAEKLTDKVTDKVVDKVVDKSTDVIAPDETGKKIDETNKKLDALLELQQRNAATPKKAR